MTKTLVGSSHLSSIKESYKYSFINLNGHNIIDHISFRSLNGTHYFNPIIYDGAFIENICCHQLSSMVTQFIMIYDHLRVSPIC